MTNVSIDGSAGTAYTSLSLFNGGTEVLFLGKTDQRSDSFGYEIPGVVPRPRQRISTPTRSIP